MTSCCVRPTFLFSEVYSSSTTCMKSTWPLVILRKDLRPHKNTTYHHVMSNCSFHVVVDYVFYEFKFLNPFYKGCHNAQRTQHEGGREPWGSDIAHEHHPCCLGTIRFRYAHDDAITTLQQLKNFTQSNNANENKETINLHGFTQLRWLVHPQQTRVKFVIQENYVKCWYAELGLVWTISSYLN